MAIRLTRKQKDFILENFDKHPDLNVLTQMLFDNKEIDGRSKEGRAVKKFLVENDLEYNIIKHKKVEEIFLTQKQQGMVIDKMNLGLSSLSIARLVFEDIEKKLTPLHKEVKCVHDFMILHDPDYQIKEEISKSSYNPPKALSRIIKRVNDSCGQELDEKSLNRQILHCLEKLKINLSNSRFVQVMNNFKHQTKRDLFEDEFIKHTWDKPDLTAEDITLYINLCKDILTLEDITAHAEQLKDLFSSAADADNQDAKMSVTLSEAIKAKTDEYDKTEKRIQASIKKLQTDRSHRLAKSHQNNASILSLVQTFQDEEEREILLKIVSKQREAVSFVANEFESMAEYKARVLGIGKRDVL